METRTILIVDDEDDIREIGILALGDVGGFTVAQASSGKAALESVESISPDIILLDVMMPEMDGMTTLKNLQDMELTANIPVIFMTARVQTAEVEEYLKLGALGVIPKPFDPMSLADTVRRIVDG